MNVKKSLKSFLVCGLIGLSNIANLSGCAPNNSTPNNSNRAEVQPEKIDYFAEFPMHTDSGIALTSGDFDGDGDVDLIVGASKPWKNNGRLYFYENDGTGNFILKPKLKIEKY